MVVAGNVGTSLTSLPGTLRHDAVVVCEASSFQLEDTEAFAPDAAVLLNLAEDHLDRHGTVEAYRAAKLRAFALQPPDAIAVAPAELRPALGGEARARHVRRRAATSQHRDGRLWWRGAPLIDADEIRLRGAHNRENAMAAAAVCLARGLPSGGGARRARRRSAASRTASRRSPTVGGVLYVNDSKATNVASAVVGLESFAPGSVHAILGGRGKGGDYAPLAAAVAERAARRVPDRRGRGGDRGGARGHRRAAARLRRPRARRRRRRAPRPAPARSSCSRPPAPPTTSTGRSRSAATTSARWSSASASKGDSGRASKRGLMAQVRAREEAAATRAPAAADGDLLPARGRCGDGLLGLVGAHAAGGPRRRHRLPRQVRRLRRGRPRADAPALAARPRRRPPARAAAPDRRVRDARAGADPAHRAPRSTAPAGGWARGRSRSSRRR